ncbi:hypothetical protein GW17_00017191 [Ensete ventricosum]|nr:hypothetical protein GW17_00017191 [Ensete ventricosum]
MRGFDCTCRTVRGVTSRVNGGVESAGVAACRRCRHRRSRGRATPSWVRVRVQASLAVRAGTGGIVPAQFGLVRPGDILPVGHRLAEVGGSVGEPAEVAVGAGAPGAKSMAQSGLVEHDVWVNGGRREHCRVW